VGPKSNLAFPLKKIENRFIKIRHSFMTNAQSLGNTPTALAHHIITLPVEWIRDLKAKVEACGDNSYTWEQQRTKGSWDLFQIREALAIWEKANGPIA
jgi:hypothetical protein